MDTIKWGQKYRSRNGAEEYVVTSFRFPYGEEAREKFPNVDDEAYFMLVNINGGYYSPPTTDIEKIFGEDRDQFVLIRKE